MSYKFALPNNPHNIKLQELEELMDKNNIKITIGSSQELLVIIDGKKYFLYDNDMKHNIWTLPRECESDVLRVVDIEE